MQTDLNSLVDILQDISLPDQTRISAVKYLHWMHTEKAIPFLFQQILDRSKPVRLAILTHLYEMKQILQKSHLTDVVDIKKALNILIYDSDAEIRELTFEIILIMQIPETKDILLMCKDDQNPVIRAKAIHFLPLFFGDQYIIPMLYDPNEIVVCEALELMKKFNLIIPLDLKERLKYNKSMKVQLKYAENIINQIKQNPEMDRTEIFEFIVHKTPFIQTKAIELLTYLKDERLIPFLSQKLYGIDENLVIICMRAIEKLKVQALKPEVIKMLHDQRRKIRQTSAEVLGNMGDFSDLDLLIPLLQDNFFEIRETIYNILEKKLDPRAIIPLIEQMNYYSVNEKHIITSILDKYPFEMILLPILQVFRNSNYVDSYISDKLANNYPNLKYLKELKKISIPYLISLLNNETLAETAAITLRGWGYRAFQPLQSYYEKASITENFLNSRAYSLITEILKDLEKNYRISTKKGFSLLL